MKTIVYRNRFDRINDLDRWVGRVLESSYGPARTEPANVVPINISETAGGFEIQAAVPGVDPANVDIQIEDLVLSIRGTSVTASSNESESEGRRVYRQEIQSGEFLRTIRLPEGLDLEKVDAEFSNGLLNIHLAKLPEVKPQALKVPIRTVHAERSTSETNN